VLAGDANRDRSVDTIDFNILASNFGLAGKTFTQGNFNYDNTVDTIDFNILASRFGQTLASPRATQLAAASMQSKLLPATATASSVFSDATIATRDREADLRTLI